MRERTRFFEKFRQDPVEKEYETVLNAVKCFMRNGYLPKLLFGSSCDYSEEQYLIASLGWNIARKRHQDIEYSNRSALFNSISYYRTIRIGGVIPFRVNVDPDKVIESKNAVTLRFLESKNTCAERLDTPDLANTVDRATNILSVELFKPSTQDGERDIRTVIQTAIGFSKLMESFRNEISEIRTQKK